MTQVMTHMITAFLQRRAPVKWVLSDEERIFNMILTRMTFPRTCDSLLHFFIPSATQALMTASSGFVVIINPRVAT